MNAPSHALEVMQHLKASYLSKLFDRVMILEDASIVLNQSPDNDDARGCIRRECHKLSGVSHSLGFDTIGDLATEIDCMIAIQNARWIDVQPKLENLLDVMETELDKADA